MYRQAYKIVVLPIDIDTKETKGVCWIQQQRWEILNDLSLIIHVQTGHVCALDPSFEVMLG